MDWDVSVNARPAKEEREGGFPDEPADKPASTDLGPCLYLGPTGQRCNSRATVNGFCRRHQPDAPSSGAPSDTPLASPRRVGAVLTILALLWPLLADIVRALIRYFR